MTVGELISRLEHAIPEDLRLEWDNDGTMILPDPERKVRAVLVALDATESVINEAIGRGYDMILTHHPLIFRPVRNLTDPRFISLIKSGVCVCSYHTRLDALAGGVNDCLAGAIGLAHTEPFGEDGMGRIGYLSEPMSTSALARHVKNALDAPHVTVLVTHRPIYRLALLGGAGKEGIEQAAQAGADAYLTGEAGYNAVLDAEGRISVLLCGHEYTERPVLSYLADLVRSAEPGCRVTVWKRSLLDEY